MASESAIYNAVRFETLRQQFRAQGRAVYDRFDPVDAWRWLHIAREVGASVEPFGFGFAVAPCLRSRPCCAPAEPDATDACGVTATVQVWPTTHYGRAAMVFLCPQHVGELRAMYPAEAVQPTA